MKEFPSAPNDGSKTWTSTTAFKKPASLAGGRVRARVTPIGTNPLSKSGAGDPDPCDPD